MTDTHIHKIFTGHQTTNRRSNRIACFDNLGRRECLLLAVSRHRLQNDFGSLNVGIGESGHSSMLGTATELAPIWEFYSRYS